MCTFTHIASDNIVFRHGLGANEPCIADYGVCSFWYLSHLSRDKQHFASDIPIGSSSNQTRLGGSSVRYGESEQGTMMAKGWIHALSESLDCSDVVTATICSKCKRQSIFCNCGDEPQPPTATVIVRDSLLKFDEVSFVASVARHNAGSYVDEAGVSRYPPKPPIDDIRIAQGLVG